MTTTQVQKFAFCNSNQRYDKNQLNLTFVPIERRLVSLSIRNIGNYVGLPNLLSLPNDTGVFCFRNN
jgi:hypothetical protein